MGAAPPHATEGRLRALGRMLAVTLALTAAGPAAARAGDGELRFLRDGEVVGRLDLEALRRRCAVETVELDDPYYGKRKAFLACPVRRVLEIGLGAEAAWRDAELLLRARDGYVRPAAGARLAEEGGYLAFADAALTNGPRPAWEPIDRRQVDPGPFYLVWARPHQRDVHRYPWPYQLVEIEIAPVARAYPHVVPRGAAPGSAAWAGFAVFRDECLACHAINGEGGKVGPDLNVPRSIVEYRPVEQVKAYIRDPGAFRYTTMPAHRHLSARQLDDLVAYFQAMRMRKHDPGGLR
jgi:mono/diheme cytochrome c family protein